MKLRLAFDDSLNQHITTVLNIFKCEEFFGIEYLHKFVRTISSKLHTAPVTWCNHPPSCT